MWCLSMYMVSLSKLCTHLCTSTCSSALRTRTANCASVSEARFPSRKWSCRMNCAATAADSAFSNLVIKEPLMNSGALYGDMFGKLAKSTSEGGSIWNEHRNCGMWNNKQRCNVWKCIHHGKKWTRRNKKCEHFFTLDVQLFLKSEWYKLRTFCTAAIQYLYTKTSSSLSCVTDVLCKKSSCKLTSIVF